MYITCPVTSEGDPCSVNSSVESNEKYNSGGPPVNPAGAGQAGVVNCSVVISGVVSSITLAIIFYNLMKQF